MRLLYLTDQVPNIDPVLGDGSALISYQLITHFGDDVEIDLLTFAAGPPVPPEIAERVRAITYLPMRSPTAGLLSSLARTAHVSAEVRRTRAGLAEFAQHQKMADVTLVHGPFLIGFAARSKGPTLFQAIDPGTLWQAHEAAMTSSPALAAYRRLKTRQGLRRERRLPPHVVPATVNEAEAQDWSAVLGRRVLALPNGVRASVPAARPAGSEPTVCFLGSLDFGPNVETATQLVAQVAPLVWQRHPSARFVIAGRNPGPEVLALAGPLVEVAANVPDVADVFARSDVAVFPDRQGFGTRNCVSEALAAGLPVVATDLAARGQQAGPLLRIGTGPAELANLVSEQLDRAGTHEAPTPAPVRSWAQAAQEYDQALRALAGRLVSPPGGTGGVR
jgi:glycosyltransferase involved in cell wall biosynthesis